MAERCPDCKRDFPSHLINDLQTNNRSMRKCPICALSFMKEVTGDPNYRFAGPRASSLYLEALEHLKGKDDEPENPA